MNDFQQAANSITEWMTQEPDTDVWAQSLYLLSHNGMPRTQAIKTYSILIKQIPHNPWLNLYCADLCMRESQTEHAITYLTNALACTIENSLRIQTLYQLVLLHYENNNHQAMLTNLETASEKLLQIVLVGQPELSLKLNSPELRQLKQRVSLRCNLDPLTLFETKEYIRTRLEIAGQPNQQIFPDSSITEIYRFSGGIPRLINSICDNALLAGYACDSKVVGLNMIYEVADDLELGDGKRIIARRAQAPLAVSTISAKEKPEGLDSNRLDTRSSKSESESFDLFVQFVDKLKDHGQ